MVGMWDRVFLERKETKPTGSQWLLRKLKAAGLTLAAWVTHGMTMDIHAVRT